MTDSATLSDSALLSDLAEVELPPTNPTDLLDWLEGWVERTAKVINDAMRDIVRSAATEYLGVTASGDEAAFDSMQSAWQEVVEVDISPMYADLYRGASLAAVIATDVPPRLARNVPAVVNQAAIDYARTATNRIVGAGASTWQAVRGELVDSLLSGKGVEDLKSTVESVTGYSEFRSDTIARTETMMAYNHGDNDGAKALGEFGPVEKVWYAALDNRTRESHADAHEQVVLFDESFIVGGSAMPFPGDGPPEETINCRCTTLHLYDGDERPDGSIVGEEPIHDPLDPEAPDDDNDVFAALPDEEVLGFIREQLDANPNMTGQQLLDSFRASGRAIPRQRFYSLVREAKGGSRAIGPTRGPIKRAAKPPPVTNKVEKFSDYRLAVANDRTEIEYMRSLGRDVAVRKGGPYSSSQTYELTEHGRAYNARIEKLGQRVADRAEELSGITRGDIMRLQAEAEHWSSNFAPSGLNWSERDAWRVNRRFQLQEAQRNLATARTEYRAGIRQALQETRDMGNGRATVRGPGRLAVKAAHEHYPTEWVNGLPNYNTSMVQRGYHNAGRRHIALSHGGEGLGSVYGADDPLLRVAIHEVGHAMEVNVNGLKEAEFAQFWKRVEGTVDSRWGDVKEGGFTDEWYHRYAGRSYAGGSAAGPGRSTPYELFTMGMEELFGINNERKLMDDDYRNWILGLLAGL